MSRTVRRQGAHQKHWYVDRLREVDQWDLERWQASTPEECRIKQNAWFHADNRPGRWSAPSWFARVKNKAFARQQNEELRRCLNRQCWEDFSPVPLVRSAGWEWF